MATNKLTETTENVAHFINACVEEENKKAESFRLVELMKEWSGFEPKMWGPTIIGFGSYHYKYESGHEGTAPLVGFSPRKAAFSLYVFTPTEKNNELLNNLGKFKMGKSCIYLKKLSDANSHTLEKMCKETIRFLQKQYGKYSTSKV